MYECMYVQVCVFFVCICVHVAIIEPPESQVALPGTVINYICQGDDTIDLLFNDSITAQDLQAGEELLTIGIDFTYDSSNHKYTVSINASILNNGTSLFCVDKSSKTAKVHIYTVEGKARQ